MTLDRDDENPYEDAEHGVLSDAGSVGTTSISILGGTAQVQVNLPVGPVDDLIDDDDIVGDEIGIDEIVAGDLVLEQLPTASAAQPDGVETVAGEEHAREGDDEDEVAVAEVIDLEVIDDETGGDETSVVRDAAGPDEAARDDVAPDHVAPDDVAVDEPARDAAADAPASEDREQPDDATGSVDDAAAPVATAPGATAPDAAAPDARAVDDAAQPPAPAPVPTTRREAQNTGAQQRVDRAHSVERVTPPDPAVVHASKRLGEFDSGRESSDLLTADRLLDHSQLTKPEPEGLWQQLVFTLSGRRVNLGDGRKARARKELDRRIGAPLPGGARFVPVLSRKGGVGKTTVTALLGMALADARDDRVIAVDANPDRGTLADRISRTSGRTVRDLVRSRSDVTGYSDISAIVARDETRLDVLSSDADPRVSEAFNDRDYRDVAVLAAHYYSLVLTDTGTGIVHSVMGATLELADQLVIVAGLSVDEARLAAETLTWLETNGYAHQVRDAVVVLNNARPGAPLVRESELETHFRTRVRKVIRVPYDTAIGAGSAIVYRDLQPATRQAARELAAAVIEGLRAGVQAA